MLEYFKKSCALLKRGEQIKFLENTFKDWTFILKYGKWKDMSYSICLSNDELFDSYYFPFTGNSTYEVFWKKMIKKFNLEMIDLVGVEYEYVPAIFKGNGDSE